MLGLKYGAPNPQVPQDGKIQDAIEVQTDGRGTVTGAKITPLSPPAPVAPDEE